MYAGCARHEPQDAHPKGVIHLEHCNIRDGDAKTKKKHSIEVYHAERRVFYLQAESVSVLLPLLLLLLLLPLLLLLLLHC